MPERGQAEERAVALVESAPDALLLVDGEGRIVLANAQAEDMFAYGPGELLGCSIDALVPARFRAAHPAHRAEFVRAPRARAMGSGRPLTACRRDGTEFPVDISLSRVQTAAGPCVAASVRDATERRQFERALLEAEERFRTALDEAPVGMALVALDGHFLRVNRALARIVGYSQEELTGLTFAAITHPDDVEAGLALASRLARGEIPDAKFGKRYVRKDGAVVHAALSVSIVRNRDGAPLYFVTQIEDVTQRKGAEEALRRSEADFRALINQASDGVFITDADGRFVDLNDAACELLGYPREELLGKRSLEVIPAESAPRLQAEHELMRTTGKAVTSEWAAKRKDGTLVSIEVGAKVLPDGRGLAFARDVSERKRVEAALRRSEASLNRAQRVAHLGSWEWDLRTNEVIRSPEMFAIFGVDPSYAALGPMGWARLVVPDDRRRLLDAAFGALGSQGSFSLEVRILRPDGSQRVVLQQGEVALEDGSTGRMVGTCLDITDRKRLEGEREQSLRWLQTVLEQAAVGMILVHPPPDPRLEANARALEMIGRPIDSIDQDPGVLHGPDGRPLAHEKLPSVRTLRGERIEESEYVLQHPHGPIPVLVSAAPILDADGKVQGGVIAFQDNREAKALDRLRAEWSSVVAHDLRQPINTIVLSAELLGRSALDAKQSRAASHILAAARRLDRMVGDLMDLSRLEARRLELARQHIDVPATVRASVDRVAQQASGRPFDLKVHGEIPQAYADADRVAQVVENLLTNAVKYGTSGTPIVVEIAPHDGEVVVAVANEGKILSDEECAGMFQRFQRSERAKLAGVQSSGLGLYIARELVEAHGGKISVRCAKDGRATFRFTLPVARS